MQRGMHVNDLTASGQFLLCAEKLLSAALMFAVPQSVDTVHSE